MDTTTWSVARIAAAVAAGETTVAGVVDAHLDRVEAWNPLLNAVVTVPGELALEAARAADRRLRSGQPPRPLEGVPFVVKDTIATAGVRTTYGSRLYRDFVPAESAVAVTRLQEAGAILLAKANVSEFGHDPYCNTYSEQFGMTRNPWDPGRTAGGSSGGVAAAVAVGMAPLGLATDWGGSIRGPAAFCGIYGLRPTPGRVPVYPHETLSGFAWDQPVEDVQGPIARHPGDLRAALRVIAGPDPRAPQSLASYSPEASTSSRVRVAYAGDFDGRLPVEPSVASACRGLVDTLAAIGVDVADAAPASVPRLVSETLDGVRPVGLVMRYGERFQQDPDSLGQFLREQVARAMSSDLAALAAGERARTRLWHAMREFMADYDVLATPTWGFAPFSLSSAAARTQNGIALGAPEFWQYTLSTQLFSVLGYPAISVPAGLTPEGLPVGVQLAAVPGREGLLIDLAEALESVCGPAPAPPARPVGEVPPVVDPAFALPYQPTVSPPETERSARRW
ncbi:MAG: amidase [Nocardioides sp.]|uniref:amidase n=1 Tax=Nocardioides sp. TaxID=35761 RepID=UPI0039E3D4FB